MEDLDNGLWEFWNHAHELDWVPTETMEQARVGLIDLYWALYDARRDLSKVEKDRIRDFTRRMRKAYRHICTFTAVVRGRGVETTDFIPHMQKRDGTAWGKPYKEPGLPPR